MKALIVTLVALLALVHAQNIDPTKWDTCTAFTADFICTAPQFGSGYFTGKIKYDWSISAFQIIFNGGGGYQEFYQFNSDRGYKTDSSSGQFAFQYLYKSSVSCPCENTGLNFAMPPLFPASITEKAISALSYWTGGALDTALPTGSATKYQANTLFVNAQSKSYILSTFYWLRNNIIAGFNINDFQRRTFAFSNVVCATPGSLGLVAPKAGCKCGKPLDIVLSLDRSGSISVDQWKLEYQFTQNLVAAFDYGPLTTNLAIVNWNANQWVNLALTSGINAASVNSAVAAMTCCPNTGGGSCCCCGTPIGGGIWLGGQALSTSTRGKAQKIIILLTDGCQNHLWVPGTTIGPNGIPTGTAVSCKCTSEKACATNATCVGDITNWYNWVQKNVPGTRIIVVGVGGADTICKDQLLLAAGGDSTNVYNPQDWSQLSSFVDSISATACTADNALCPGCCGICTCGQCIPPTDCLSTNCTTGKLVSGCCISEPVECPPINCYTTFCDNAQGGCIKGGAKGCPPKSSDGCYEYLCNATTGSCDPEKVLDKDGNPLPQCVTVVPPPCKVTDCEDNNACTIDECKNNRCVNSDASDCPETNACALYSCDPQKGCVVVYNTNCDDGNNCTIDTCDTTLGCQHTNVTCTKTTDVCKYTICDPIIGCIDLPRDCTKEGYKAENCTVPACNGTNAGAKGSACYNQFVCAAPPPKGEESVPTTTILVSTLTTAAVAGIVVAAVLVAAGVGGGAAVAVAQAAAGGGAVVTASNPLYAGAATSGNNPLNQAQ